MSKARPLRAAFGFPVGTALGMCATALLVAGEARQEPFWSLAVMIAVVSFVALVSTTAAAMATVVVCWALHAGFVLGRWGELAFTARSANDALVLVVCALAVCGVASLRRAEVREPDGTAPSSRTAAVPAPRQPDAGHAGRRLMPVNS